MSKRSTQEPDIIQAQVIDYDPLQDPNRSLASSLLPCYACGTPRQIGSRFCVSCGIPFETPNQFGPDGNSIQAIPAQKADRSARTANGPLPESTEMSSHGGISVESQDMDPNAALRSFRCESCGSEVDVPGDQRSLRCPFCDSAYVAELPLEQRTCQRPEFIIGFEVSREKALDLFFQWIGKNSFFRPGDLVRKAATEKQQGVYIPFWHFSMIAMSQWSAQIGEHWYRTETYTVKNAEGKSETRTRTVQETEWWPLSGVYRKYYSGYMVSASKGLPQQEALAIQPYRLNTMMRYRPMYLAGWLSEEYSISREVALATTQQEFRNRERNAISRFLPGDVQSGLSVETDLEVGGSDLVLLPVHVLSYRYGDRVYRFLVNGQTGKMVGEKPWSGSRIALFVFAIILLIVVAVVLIYVFNQLGLNQAVIDR